jgi:hypothetical protein
MGYYAINSHARWGTDGVSVSWDENCAVDISGILTSDNKVLLMQIDNTNAHGVQSITAVLQYSKDGGAFVTITNVTDWVYQGAIAFNDGDATTSNICTAPVGNWHNGEKDENNSLPALTLGSDEYTEYWFSIRGANAAAGSVYRFRLYDTAEGAEVPIGGNLATYIQATMLSAGVSIPVISHHYKQLREA